MNKVDIIDEAKLLLLYPHGALLINDQGEHYKFYNIYKQDNLAIVNYGRIGKKPRTYSYYSYEAKNKIREKINKGYKVIREF